MSGADYKKDAEYKYVFKDSDQTIVYTGKGLNEEVVREISRLKGEPEWMLEYRLKSLKAFYEAKLPDFGPDLSTLDYDSYTYFNRVAKKESQNWDEVPETVKNTFNKLGIPEAEQKY